MLVLPWDAVAVRAILVGGRVISASSSACPELPECSKIVGKNGTVPRIQLITVDEILDRADGPVQPARIELTLSPSGLKIHKLLLSRIEVALFVAIDPGVARCGVQVVEDTVHDSAGTRASVCTATAILVVRARSAVVVWVAVIWVTSPIAVSATVPVVLLSSMLFGVTLCITPRVGVVAAMVAIMVIVIVGFRRGCDKK
jgi:hypothetical protein